jgi:8-oxo-dGTP diphosphatase
MFIYKNYWAKLILENKKFISAHVVIFNNGSVLIVRRSPADEWMPGHYGLPGGKLDGNETPKQAVERECKEEVGLTVSQENLVFLPKVSADKEHCFYYTTKFDGEPRLDFEHDDFQWVNPKDLSNFKTVPDLIDIVGAALEDMK